jgi:hypothetical protein
MRQPGCRNIITICGPGSFIFRRRINRNVSRSGNVISTEVLMSGKTVTKGFLILAAGLISAPTLAADVGFGVNVNIGNMLPAPIYAPAPVYIPAPVVITAPPMFIAPPSLGLSIAVGVPFDMFQVSGNYYLYKGNQWYCGPQYGGPWRTVSYQKLPHQLRQHNVEHYRHVRDREYQSYNRNREEYHGRYYQASHDGGGKQHGSGRNGEQVARNSGKGEGRSQGEGRGKD